MKQETIGAKGVAGLCLLLLGAALPVSGQPTSLVKDVNTTSDSSFGMQPTSIVAAGGSVFLAGTAEGMGVELWKSDGTSGGTVLVKDIWPGAGSSNPSNIVAVGSAVYFFADDGVNGKELWRSDGTGAGTTIVKDVFPGSGSSLPMYLTVSGGVLYFSAADTTINRRLWRSDGTGAGTRLVVEPCGSSCPSNVSFLADVGGVLFFGGSGSGIGQELWKSNGTVAGTVLVKDVCPGGCGGNLSSLANVGGTLFFAADDGTNGQELWRSDGTKGGTTLVKDVWSGASASSPTNLVAVGSTLFFLADDGTAGRELWKSDGTPGGTSLVKDIQTGSGGSSIQSPVAISGILYFSAQESAYGRELWKSDGSSAGTVLVKDVCSGPGCSGNPGNLAGLGGALFFSANDGTNGGELWKSDGSGGGTAMVKDACVGGCGSNPALLVDAGGTLFFRGLGGELWKSNGTDPGTVVVRELATLSSFPASFVEMGGLLYFVASDGTVGGTALVVDIGGGSGVQGSLVRIGSTLFFAGNEGTNGTELWKSDGTPGGTSMVKDICGGGCSSSPTSLVDVSGTLFFRAWDDASGWELWKSDGTDPGTVLVKDVCAGAGCNGNPGSLVAVGSTLFFTANDGTNGTELWKSDGTESGTVMVEDICPDGCPSNPTSLVNVNGTLFFRAVGDGTGWELWKSDGTGAGTAIVRDICPGGCSSYPDSLTAVGSSVLFSAWGPERELWKSDGTAAGTLRVKDVCPGPCESSPAGLLAAGSRLFFGAQDGTRGVELWVTDGTEAGTTLVRDISPGASSSIPRPVQSFGSWVLYAASDGTSGEEPWKSDGTLAGTVRIQDLNPGSGHSNVTEALLVGTKLLLAGDDGSVGNELRSLSETDLSIALAGAPDPVSQGATLTYTATITNQGPLAATNAKYAQALPAGVSFVSVTPGSPTCTQAAGMVSCNLGGLAASAVTTVTVQVSPAAGTVGTISSTGRASALEADPDPTDDAATATTVVSGPLPARDLQAMPRSASTVDLKWTDPQSSETGFRLERSTDGTTFSPFDIVGPNVTTYTDAGRTAATLHYYRVVALQSGAGESAASNVASATTFASTAAKVCGALLGAYHGSASSPSVAWSGTGWAAAWSDKKDGSNAEVWFQRLASATGAPAGAPVRVTTSGTGTSSPTLRWNGSAYGLVFTEGLATSGTNPATVRFALLDANGAKLRGDVVLGLTGNRTGAGQEAALVWTGSGWGLFASEDPAPPSRFRYLRLDTDGDLVGSIVTLSATSNWALSPSAAWNGTEYGVAWTEMAQDGLSSQVLFRRFAIDGTALGGAATVVSSFSAAAFNAGIWATWTSIVWDGSSWVVAYVDGVSGPEDAEAIYLRRLAANGTPSGASVRLSHDLDPDNDPADLVPVYDETPVLFTKPGGGFVVFTTSGLQGSFGGAEACRYDADSSLSRVGSRVVISTMDSRQSMRTRAAADGTGRYLAAWVDSRSGVPEVADVLVDSAGATLAGPTELTSGHVAGAVSNPVAVALGSGFGALYPDSDGSGTRLYGTFWNGSGTQTASGVSMTSRFVRGRPAAVASGSSFALAFKDSFNALVFRRFGSTGAPLIAETVLATNAGGLSEVALAWSGQEYGLAAFRDNVLSFLRVAPDGSTCGSFVDVASAPFASGLGPQIEWVGSGWAIVWMNAAGLFYALLGPDGSVVVSPIPVTFTYEMSEDGLELCWNGQDLGLAWHEYALPDPPGGEVYFTVLGLDGIKRFSPVAVLSGPYDDEYPSLYWDVDRFRIVAATGDPRGLREGAVMPDGTFTSENRLYSIAAGRSGVAWNGATLGIAWLVDGYAGFLTTACHADVTPPPCAAVTATWNGSATALGWSAVTDPESGVFRYSIYRDGALLMRESPPTTSFVDGGVVPGTPHAYQVRPLSWAMLEPSSCATATPSADLAVSKSDGQAFAVPGQQVSYTITLTNGGPSAVTEVTLTDPPPASLLSPVFTPSSGSYVPGTGAWTGLALGSGQSATLTLTATISSAATGSLSNTATVAARGGVYVDPSSANNVATDLDSLVALADLSVTKVDPATVSRGANVTYTIAVTNLGPSDATGVSLADPTPSGLTFVSNIGDCVSSFPCSLGAVPAGGSRTVTATFSIPVGYAGANPLLNTATVSASTADPVAGNNSATASTPVDARSLRTLAPCRLVDTRNAAGPFGGPSLSAGGTRTFGLSGRCGVPSSARALVLNVTVTQPTDDGTLALFPGGTAPSGASTVNYKAGVTRANNSVSSLNASGELDVVCQQTTGTVHVILDVSGYFE